MGIKCIVLTRSHRLAVNNSPPKGAHTSVSRFRPESFYAEFQNLTRPITPDQAPGDCRIGPSEIGAFSDTGAVANAESCLSIAR
jgi:hypothetical protein